MNQKFNKGTKNSFYFFQKIFFKVVMFFLKMWKILIFQTGPNEHN